MYDFFWCLKPFQTTTCLSISILNIQLVTFSPWFILPGCQPNFACVYLLDTNNDWVPVRLRARFPKRQFGAGINYLSSLHTTNLPPPNQPMIEIACDNSPLLGVPEVNIATDHPRKGRTAPPYVGEDPFICVRRLFCKACMGRDFFFIIFFPLDFLVCRCVAVAFS